MHLIIAFYLNIGKIVEFCFWFLSVTYLQTRKKGKQRIHPGPSVEHGLVDVHVEQERGLADVPHYGLVVLREHSTCSAREMNYSKQSISLNGTVKKLTLNLYINL